MNLLQELFRILRFVVSNFQSIWYLLILTIPLGVIIRRLDVSDSISHWLYKNIHISILMATLIGAIAPFCSCSVIPVISSMLIAGVPLAPVMSFWLASPSMDPEIFFLSVGSLGYPLAIARITATFLMSLFGGYLVYWIFGNRKNDHQLKILASQGKGDSTCKDSSSCSSEYTSTCDSKSSSEYASDCGSGCKSDSCSGNIQDKKTKYKVIFGDIMDSALLVLRFLFIAYILEAIIIFYIPESIIQKVLGGSPLLSVLKASAISIPLYTTNISALGIIGGLTEKGLNQGAALAFLIGGATTTIPAMSAVYQLVEKKVFFIYLFVAIGFSFISGLIFNLLNF